MIYEFECPKGHVTEEMVPTGTTQVPCEFCNAPHRASHRTFIPAMAQRILSPTRTTFVFADTRKRIRQIEHIARKE